MINKSNGVTGQLIQIKRSTQKKIPLSLQFGELAFGKVNGQYSLSIGSETNSVIELLNSNPTDGSTIANNSITADKLTENAALQNITAGTTAQYLRGDKTWQELNKVAVGLSNVANVDTTNASNITTGTLNDERLSSNVTLEGNEFNGANQLLKLDSSGKISMTNLPADVLGSLSYVGIWNADTNTPTILSGTGIKGQFYKVSVAGSTSIDGIGEWKVGDWIVYNGTTWDKIDNTETVSSVNGQVGNVVITKSDVGLSNVDNTSDINKPISTSTQSALNLKANITDVNTSLDLKADKSTTYTKTEVDASLNLKEDKSNKGVAGGYAGLDSSGKVPLSQLPSTSISTLSDVNLANLSGGEVLVYNSSLTKWENKAIQDVAGGEIVPIGTIQAYYSNTIPAGYLLCNGSTFNASEYPELNTFLGGTTLPDLRGIFLRGAGITTANGMVNGANYNATTVKAFQDSNVGWHSHQLNNSTTGSARNFVTNNGDGTLLIPRADPSASSASIALNARIETFFSQGAGGTISIAETRPKNIGVNYIIKAKNNPASAYNVIAGTNISITKNELDKTATISSTGYTNSQIDTALNLKANITDVNTSLDLKADKSTTYTKIEVDTALNLKANITDVNTSLDLKADKSTTYTKTEVSSLINSITVEADSLNNFPNEGLQNRIYVAKDTNKIYRYESAQLPLPQLPEDSIISITTSITNSDNLQNVINNSQNGDAIFLANGTYLINQNLLIDKEISLVGESQAGVIIQDTRGNSESFVNITANNVILKDLTIIHSTTNPTGIDFEIFHAITVSGGGSPQTRLNNVRLYNVKSQYSQSGLSLRCDNFIVKGCTFEVISDSFVAGSRLGICHYGNGGNSFITNCHFINSPGLYTTAIFVTSNSILDPTLDHDMQSGALTIEGSTFTGSVSQFIFMENHQGNPEDFELIVKNNTTPEDYTFIVSYNNWSENNFADIFKRVVLINNNLRNSYASGLGVGAFTIWSGEPFRSSPLPVVAFDNILGQLELQENYFEADGSFGSLFVYRKYTGYIVPPPVVKITTTLSDVNHRYIELAPQDEQRIMELLDLKADKSTTYTKTEVDTSLDLKADKSTTYTKTEVDNLKIDGGEF
jgi:microcystin-dependent protein